MKRRYQILLIFLAAIILVYGFSTGYIAIYTKNRAVEDAKQITESYAEDYAYQIKSDLDSDLGLCRALASAFKSKRNVTFDKQLELYNRILKTTYKENSNYLTIWNSWELNKFKSGYIKTHGRIRSECKEVNNEIVIDMDSLDLEKDNVNSIYYSVKLKNTEIITKPYWYSLHERLEDKLVTSIAVPIKIDGEFAGLAGVDRSLESFQDTVSEIRPYEESYAYLLSNNGSFIAHPNSENLGKQFSVVSPSIENEFNIEQKIKDGKNFSFTFTDEEGDEMFVTHAPFSAGYTQTPWSLAIVVPYKVIVSEPNAYLTNTVIIGIVGVLVLILILGVTTNIISNNLITIASELEKLSKGNIPKAKPLTVKKQNDDLGIIKSSVNQLVEGLNKTVEFAGEIGKGNLNAEFTRLSKEDALGNSLLTMRENLLRAREEEEKRREEDNIRNWTADGFTKINDILRITRNKDIEEFSAELISTVINYLDANQGGLFFLETDNDGNQIIDLKAAYAYNRRKMFEKRIKPGVGLIGRAVKEKRTIYLTEVPQHYINITSGLGRSTPNNLLVVPLISEDTVYGVIEIAAFKKFQKYERDFIARISETIASAIASIEYNNNITQLLEESQRKSDELSRREKEMEHNLSELRTVQEESNRARKEMEGIMEAITATSSIVHLDPGGKITKIDESKTKDSCVYEQNAIGRYLSELDPTSVETPEDFEKFWKEVTDGNVKEKTIHIDIYEDERWIAEIFTPIFNKEGKLEKIIIIQSDITQSKQHTIELENRIMDIENRQEKLKSGIKKVAEYRRQLIRENESFDYFYQSVDKALIRAEMTPDGTILDINENFAQRLNTPVNELKDNNLFSVTNIEPNEPFENIFSNLRNGVVHQGEFKFEFESGQTIWLLVTLSPQFDKKGTLAQVLFLAYDVTQSKELEIKVRDQASQLKQKDERLQKQLKDLKASQRLILQKNARFESIQEAVDKAFVRAELTPNGRFIDFNPNFINLLAYSSDKLKKSFINYIIADTYKEQHKNAWKEVQEGKIVHEEFQVIRKNGDLVWLDFIFSPYYVESKMEKIVCIGYDITNLKEMEKEITLQNTELKNQEELMRANLKDLQTQINELEKQLKDKEAEIQRLKNTN